MANTYTKIYIQFVFAVQDRLSLIRNAWKDELYKYIIGIVQNNKHKLIAINGMANHIHVFVGYKPHQLIPDLLQDLHRVGLTKKDLLKENFNGRKVMGLSHTHILKLIM